MFSAINTEQASFLNQNPKFFSLKKFLSALYFLYIKDSEGQIFKKVKLLMEISNDKQRPKSPCPRSTSMQKISSMLLR